MVKRQKQFILGLSAMSCWLFASPAVGYGPIDDLTTSVAQLFQSGQILDASVAAGLTDRLQAIGALIDGGDKTTAASLLASFTDEVGARSGQELTSAAAVQLTQTADSIAEGLQRQN